MKKEEEVRENKENQDETCHCLKRELNEEENKYNQREMITLPRLKIFRAISKYTYDNNCKSEEDDQYGTTERDFKINAPNVEELMYKNYFGWDATLFESCYSNLKIVHLEMKVSNMTLMIEAVEKLVACERLTLVSTSCLYEDKTSDIKHPFEGNLEDVSSIPCKSLTNLKELIIIGDDELTGKGLIQFVKYKKETDDCQDLERLSLQQCLGIEEIAIDELESEVPQFEYRIDKEKEEDSEADADSAGSYDSD